jgi:hypothetical protein
MANKPVRINIQKSQLELVERCLAASSLPTKAALFSHFLTLYSEDYLRRFGADGKPSEPNLTSLHQEAIRADGKPSEPLNVQKPTQNSQNTPFVEIIED